MAITLMNPGGLPKADVLHQVSVATGSKMVFVAGQVAWDADGNTVGEGDSAQVERCYLNVATALAEAGRVRSLSASPRTPESLDPGAFRPPTPGYRQNRVGAPSITPNDLREGPSQT